jgi:hypothetical protein
VYPLIIPVFNNPTYLQYFYEQVKKLNFSRIDIYDNSSDYPPMIDLLRRLEIEPKVRVIRLEKNYGPHYVIRNPDIYSSLDEIFCLSDPDIAFSPDLPGDFLEVLKQISEEYEVGKVGFAIEVPEENEFEVLHIKMDGKLQNMKQWESKFWQKKIGATKAGDEIYNATIDTTFALYNKKYFRINDRYESLRVAGRFVSRHLGFYKSNFVPKEEIDFYKTASKFSYFSGRHDSDGNPTIEITVHEYTLMLEELESTLRNNKNLTRERDYLNSKLQEVYTSRSWRLTKRLREIAAKFRKDQILD